MPASKAPTEPALACGNCHAPMRRLAVDGHYGRKVELDLCRNCDLVWFDGIESAGMAGSGLLGLVGAMAEAYALPHEMLRPGCACPRCAMPLQTVHNQSRWGKSLQLQCPKRDGAYQSFAQFLQEKGLLRPMSANDRAGLIAAKGSIACVNCGAGISESDEVCPFCRSVPSLLDVARLARALDPRESLAPHPTLAAPARQAALACAACGAALPPGQNISCPQCHATLAIDSLKAAYAAVQALEAALRHAQAHPSPEVVKRRLDALDTDMARQREYIDELSRENAYGADANWKFRGRNRWFDADKWRLRLIVGAGVMLWLMLQFASGIKH